MLTHIIPGTVSNNHIYDAVGRYTCIYGSTLTLSSLFPPHQTRPRNQTARPRTLQLPSCLVSVGDGLNAVHLQASEGGRLR